MTQRFFIDGVEVKNPLNYALNEIEVNFDKGDVKAQVSIDSWELGVQDPADSSDAANIALARKDGGLTGGLGVTEGLPFRVDIDKAGVQLNIFDGYLNLWKARYGEGVVTAPATEQGKIDWLKGGACDFSFEYLEYLGLITEANYIMVPYVIQADWRAGFMATISIFFVTDRISKEITSISELTIEANNPLEASAIPRIVLRIAYLAVLLFSLVKLVIDMFNLIVQPIKYHAVMRVVDLLTIGFQYLGLNFSSSIWQNYPYNTIAILPKKHKTFENSNGIFAAVKGLFDPYKIDQKGYPGEGYTMSDLLAFVQTNCNAKIVSDGTTVRIERQDYNLSTAQYQLRPVDGLEYTLNEEDFVSNFILEYATDTNDKNTMQKYLGTIYQVQIVPQSVLNKKMVLTSRVERININFARGIRKTELTFPEKIFNVFFKSIGEVIDLMVQVLNALIKVANAIIKLINKIIKALGKIGIDIDFQIPTIRQLEPTNFSDLIEDRLDMMLMDNDDVNVMKLIMVGNNSNPRNNKLLADNESVISAKYLWDNFHFIKSFVPQPGNPLGNQYYIYPTPKDYFTYEDYVKVMADNKIISADGTEQGRIDSFKWNIDEQVFSGQHRIQRTYTKNLIEIKTEPDGR